MRFVHLRFIGIDTELHHQYRLTSCCRLWCVPSRPSPGFKFSFQRSLSRFDLLFFFFLLSLSVIHLLLQLNLSPSSTSHHNLAPTLTFTSYLLRLFDTFILNSKHPMLPSLLHRPIPLFAFSWSSCATAALLHQSFLLFALSSSSCAAVQLFLPSHLLLLHVWPENLFSSSSYLRSISWILSVGSRYSLVSIDTDCLLHLAFLERIVFRSSLFSLPFSPHENRKLCQLAHGQVVSLSHSQI